MSYKHVVNRLGSWSVKADYAKRGFSVHPARAQAEKVVVGAMRLAREKHPEHSHKAMLYFVRWQRKRVTVSPSLCRQFFGRDVCSPIGLAAGVDKNGIAIRGWGKLGVGFVELGSVTPKPQKGNQNPRRIFHLEADGAIINNFGINNYGSAALADRLKRTRLESERKGEKLPLLGVNVAANTETLLNGNTRTVVDDYRRAIDDVIAYSDWITLNLSCPNVRHKGNLSQPTLTAAVIEAARSSGCGWHKNKGVPLLAKISPDMKDDELCQQVASALAAGVDGFIVSNTSKSRPHNLKSHHKKEIGGLSGLPIKQRSLQLLRLVRQQLPAHIPIISCGGISDGADVVTRLAAGASAVQLYTALTYSGTRLIDDMHKQMMRHMKHTSLTQLVQSWRKQ